MYRVMTVGRAHLSRVRSLCPASGKRNMQMSVTLIVVQSVITLLIHWQKQAASTFLTEILENSKVRR